MKRLWFAILVVLLAASAHAQTTPAYCPLTGCTFTGPIAANGGLSASALTGLTTPMPVAEGGTGSTGGTGYAFGNGSGAFTFSPTIPLSAVVGSGSVVPAPGETIQHAVSRLPSTGGTVVVPIGTWFTGDIPITTSNVTVVGSGMPVVNSAETAFIPGSGTILQGSLTFEGASNITVMNLGVDVGDAFNVCTDEGLVVEPAGNSITSPMIYNVTIENVATLACDKTFAPASQQHSVRVGNVTNLYESNIHTDKGFYGVVAKSTNVVQVGIFVNNAYSNGWICKSDDVEGTCANVSVSGLIVSNSGCPALDTYGGTVSNVAMSNVQVYNTAGTCTYGLMSHIVTDPATGVSSFVKGVEISNFILDNIPGDALVFANGTTDVTVSNGTISHGGGNGVDFQQTGTSGNTAANLNLDTLAGYGVYGFGATDAATGINCNAVTSGCLAESGSGGVMFFNAIRSTTQKFTSIVNGAFTGRFSGETAFTCAATTLCPVYVAWGATLPSLAYYPVCQVQTGTAGTNYNATTYVQNQSTLGVNVGVYVNGATALPTGTTVSCTVDTNN